MCEICTLQGAYYVVEYRHKGGNEMAISYKGAFDRMKAAGVTTYRIRKENIMSQSTLQKLREGRPVSTEAIERLCLLLDCTPNDVMEIVR